MASSRFIEFQGGDVEAYLRSQEEKDLLRFITCGSVDDGKSTLIGRLLYEAKMLFEDQLSALEADSKRVGTQGGALDFALLVDGLSAEREQGITIDVAYRAFTTDKRKFIVADTPGHEQYTRNMATGASTADLAVLLVDARVGLLEQTRRHATIATLMGIKQFVLAVNKIDLTDYDRARFEQISHEFKELALSLGVRQVTAIPVSALKGENVVYDGSASMPWYEGPTLIEVLELATTRSAQTVGFRLPVQRVSRPGESFRGYQGTVAGGSVKPGDSVVILPSGMVANVTKIVTFDLVRNAAEALLEAGRHDGKVTIEARRDCAGSVTVRVRDNGPGFDPELVERASAPFTTTKPDGLGLGLSLARSVIEAHGGRLAIESSSRGAVVSFTLQDASSPAEAA